MAKIKAIIFDFDGLMVNTEELRFLSFIDFVARYGKKFKKKDYIKTVPGTTAENTTKLLMDMYDIVGDVKELTEERYAIFKNLFDNRLAFMEGVVELLERIKNWNVKCAVASGRNREAIVEALTRFDVMDQFETIVTPAELVESTGKPHPEVYLIAAKRLKVDPKYCLALEDSHFGIEAAKAAGMKAVFVPEAKFFDTANDKADIILESLHGLTEEVLDKLAQI